MYYVNRELIHRRKEAESSKRLGDAAEKSTDNASGKVVSLNVMTLNNERQKVNDKPGNPIEIGVVVIWRVVNAATPMLMTMRAKNRIIN